MVAESFDFQTFPPRNGRIGPLATNPFELQKRPSFKSRSSRFVGPPVGMLKLTTVAMLLSIVDR